MQSVFNPETKVWKGLELPWPFPLDVHISEIVLDGLKKTPKKLTQISADDGTEETCDDLRLKIIRFAQNLKRLGIKDEDVVGVVCSNTVDLMAYVNGIIQLGAIVNPMSVEHSTDDLINMFKQTQPKLVICDSDVYEKVHEALRKLEYNLPIYTARNEIEGVPFADDLLKTTGDEANYQVGKFKNASHKVMAILSSSGSTGPAKGVSMSQTFYLKMTSLAPKEENRSLSFSPIFWGSAFGSLILAAITSETRIVTRKPFSVETFLDIASKYKVSYWLMNPPKLTLLLQSPLMEKFDTSNVKTLMALGGIVNEQMRQRVKEIFPKAFFLIFYSLTEVSVTMTFPGVPIDGLTVGYVQPNHQLKIVDEDGNALGVGEIGEIYARLTVVPFLGYFNNPHATAEALDKDGFLKTGDIGYVDAKGYVYVIDRKKEIFKYSGYQINPSEIEHLIQSIEGVEFVAVVGIPNPETYNLAAAVIKKKQGFDGLKEQDIVDHVAKSLPSYKHLHGGAFFVDSFPTTATQKILKRGTKDLAIKLYNERKTITKT